MNDFVRKLRNITLLREIYTLASSRTLNVDQLLLGRENGLNPNGYAEVVGNLLWTSTTLRNSPHVRFLSQFLSQGESVLETAVLEQTDYYNNAMRNIELFSHYYEAKSKHEVIEKMRGYANQLREYTNSQISSDSLSGFTVRPILNSAYYQILDNHHDIALAHVMGKQQFKFRVARTKTQTAMQEILGRVLWFDGNHELYQPVDIPEVQGTWALTRKCSDRFLKMQNFMRQREMEANLSYLDVGSFYGWFVHKMLEDGLDAYGVELDPIAASVGFNCYSLPSSRVYIQDSVNYLMKSDQKYDVISCLSVLHHFVLGNQRISAEEFIQLLANATKQVLFFETGQGHESWFSGQLSDWTPDFIEDWVLSHTDFKRAYRLGTDEDARPPHANDYGRTLFAFVR